MLACVRKLSQGLPYVRTDFYSIDDRIYFGEITFFHAEDDCKFSSEKFEQQFSLWLKLPGGDLLKTDDYVLYARVMKQEPAMQDQSEQDLKDYKFYCFGGKVKLLGIYSDRNKNCPTKADYFDENFHWIDMTWGYMQAEKRPEKPAKFREMVEIAEKLSAGFPTIRVDLYLCGERIYFGELTFFDGSGFDKIETAEWNYKKGSWINLPEKQG